MNWSDALAQLEAGIDIERPTVATPDYDNREQWRVIFTHSRDALQLTAGDLLATDWEPLGTQAPELPL